MMAFNLFNPAQLPTGLPPATPIKSEDSNAQADALRILTSSALLGGSPMPFGGPMPLDAVRAMFPGVPFPIGLYPGPPQEFSNPGAIPPQFFDSIVGFHPYGGIDGSRRKNATRETTAPLKEWLTQHRTNPYPTKGEKVMLAVMTKMTLTQKWLEDHQANPYPNKTEKIRLAYTANLSLTQVSTWFANARRRLKKENGGSVTVKRRPEDGDDDDDMAELDRPSSSNSNGSDIKEEDGEGGENENVKEETEQMTPKRKIFSIDDIIDSSKRMKKDEEASSSKKDSPSSEESAPSLAYPWQQQMQQFMAMCRANPQFMTGPLRPPFLPFNSLMMSMGAMPTTPTGPPLNGSFTSETTSVSPSSSHSPSAPPAEEPKSSPKAAEA